MKTLWIERHTSYYRCLRLKAERLTKAKRRKVESAGCLKSAQVAPTTRR